MFSLTKYEGSEKIKKVEEVKFFEIVGQFDYSQLLGHAVRRRKFKKF
jgi:hypothetical protein